VNTHHAADNLRKNNITVYGMGIGTHVSTDEITELAGGHQNVHRVSDLLVPCAKFKSLLYNTKNYIILNGRSLNVQYYVKRPICTIY
jgi:hypothetical protein